MKTEPHLPVLPFFSKDRLVVGVSGGSDSLGLLYLLLESLPRAADRLIVAHVNYGLRGLSADRDEALVRGICQKEGLGCYVLKRRNFIPMAKRQKRSLQDLARELRYGFFQKIAQRHKAWGAAVAHHMEDQAETILDRLLRGSGSRGLSGLRPVQILKFNADGPGLKVWRPLLGFSKQQIRSYLQERGVKWREDHTNQQTKYRRNQIRQEVLPFLTRWNPSLPKVLSRMGEVTAAEDTYLESLLKPLERKLRSRWENNGYSCHAGAFAKVPVALQRRWIRSIVERLTEEARGLSFERIEEVLKLWLGFERGPRDLGFGLTAGKSQNKVFVRVRGR